ncbi:MAG: glycoside hydrolase family 3 N-terminal domain-containing protein, partial [Verrucomicrobiota bacterium]
MDIPAYKNSQIPIHERIADLLGRMTREEKIGQLGQVSMADYANQRESYLAGVKAGRWGSRILAETAWAGNNAESAINVSELNEIQRVAVEESRLGIPLLYGRDVIYGHRTVFPIPHSQAASFNPELIEKAMTCVAAEASSEGVHWTFSPVLDLTRDPRWGRVIESYSEDPFLIASLGCAAIRGFQGANPAAPDRLLACAKHFAGYGGEGGRDYDTTEWSDNTLHNMILPQFAAAAKTGVATMMAGFNDLGGTPMSANRSLMRDWLKKELGWSGFIVSDWGSIFDLIGNGVAAGEREAALLAFKAGIDLEMTAGFYERNLAPLLDAGLIPAAWLDEAVTRILRAKFQAGLFETPYTEPSLAAQTLRHPDHVALAVELASQAVVLLKNRILPLSTELKKIAVIGPFAEARREHLGSWCVDGRPSEVTTILEGLRAAAPGVDFLTANPAFSDAMIDTARQAEITILCVGESHVRNGENKSL